MKNKLLLEDRIINEVKKEKFLKEREVAVEDMMCEVIYVERNMLSAGISREKTNSACRQLIEQHERNFRKKMINENIFSKMFYKTVGTLAPGVVDFLKKKFILYILNKLNVSADTVIGNFLVNTLKNVKFLEIFGYFKEGKCSLVIETIMRSFVDTVIDYVISELGKTKGSKGVDSISAADIEAFGADIDDEDTDIIPLADGAPNLNESFIVSEAANDPSFLTAAGNKLITMGVPEEALQFFDNASNKMSGQLLIQIIQDQIKTILLPSIVTKVSEIVCSDLSFEESFKAFKDSSSSTTSKNKIKKFKSLKDAQAFEDSKNKVEKTQETELETEK